MADVIMYGARTWCAGYLSLALLACTQGGPPGPPLVAADLTAGTDLPVAADLAPPALPPDLAPPPDLLAPPPVLVMVPGGTFLMGSPEGSGFDSERPAHLQTTSTFYLDRTEVTVAAYELCVRTQGCSPPAPGDACNYEQLGRQAHPVNCVTLSQAAYFCERQGKRLPGEIEWEYAARGPSGSTYPWGNESPDARLCWSGVVSRFDTCPVDSFPRTLLGRPDPAGLADLAGNVWEWVQDAYCTYPLVGINGGVDCSPINQVLRGGSARQDNPLIVRAAGRDSHRPTNRNYSIGFRCAKSGP